VVWSAERVTAAAYRAAATRLEGDISSRDEAEAQVAGPSLRRKAAILKGHILT